MSDYSTKFISEGDVRNFFTPPLSYSDISTAEILLKIEAVENYISSIWGINSESDARIPALLLVASKIIQNASLAQKYLPLSAESIGKDYSYRIATSSKDSNPYSVAKTWEEIALEILNAKCSDRWKIRVVND